MNAKEFLTLVKETFREWSEDKVSRLAAALAYYTIFSLAPFLVIVIAVAGFFFGQQAVEGQIVGQIEGLVGTEGAQMIETMIAAAWEPGTGIIATVLSVILLIIGAAGLFGQLQDALNVIWEVQPKPDRGIKDVIRDRFLSFTMVLGVGFLLLVSLVLSAALNVIGQWFTDLLPQATILVQVINLVLSLAIITLLFAMIYKILPDVVIGWRDVWLGAAVTAVLFVIGKELIGFYLGRAAVASAYGAAGSLVVLLLWVFYSAQILFLGAEFTQVYARKHGSKIIPAENAERVRELERAQQGMPHKEVNRESVAIAGPIVGRKFQKPALQEEYKPGILRAPRSPAEKSMTALGGLLLALAGFLGTTIIRLRKR
jgi:membrane protein